MGFSNCLLFEKKHRGRFSKTQKTQENTGDGSLCCDKSLTFGLKWVVKGTYWNFVSNGVNAASHGVYELVIDVLKLKIVHFVFKS